MLELYLHHALRYRMSHIKL